MMTYDFFQRGRTVAQLPPLSTRTYKSVLQCTVNVTPMKTGPPVETLVNMFVFVF